MASETLYTDRARAESFGSLAEQYERARPGYPDALLGDLAALRPERVLDVGCGTGKAAVALAARGLSVLGVELDTRMAAIARSRGVPVEISSFESWDDSGRQVDLIVSGQAWHWIDPAHGVEKAARVLRPGGRIARFWNYTSLDEPAQSALQAVYRDRPARPHPSAPAVDASDDPFEHDGRFVEVETKTYPWERTYTADEWVSLVTTYSDHQQLPADELAQLQRDLHATIEGLGGVVHAGGGTYAVLARRTVSDH